MDASSTSTSLPPSSPTVQRRVAPAFQRIQRQKSPESPSKPSKSLNSPPSLRPRPSFCLPLIFLIFLFLCIDGIFATNSTVQLEGWRLFDEEFPQNPAKFVENLDGNGRRQFALELANNDGHRRQKRQWGYGGPQQQQQQMMCPPQCFQCSPMHCQAYQCIQPQMMNMMRCCCRPAIIMHPQPDLKTACDGEEAVAACLNGLCGQGFFCNARKFCCRCQNGKSLGQCMNGLCPAGYACNSNNFCCAIGAGSVLGPCANGKCPEGYECGAGELCYARTGNSAAGTSSSSSNSIRRNYPPIRRPRPRWSPNGGSRSSGGRGGGFGAGKRRRNQRGGRNGGSGGNGWGRRFGGEGEDWWQQEAAEFIQEAGEDY